MVGSWQFKGMPGGESLDSPAYFQHPLSPGGPVCLTHLGGIGKQHVSQDCTQLTNRESGPACRENYGRKFGGIDKPLNFIVWRRAHPFISALSICLPVHLSC